MPRLIMVWDKRNAKFPHLNALIALRSQLLADLKTAMKVSNRGGFVPDPKLWILTLRWVLVQNRNTMASTTIRVSLDGHLLVTRDALLDRDRPRPC